MVQNLWDKKGQSFETGLEELVYRSNLLGQDRSIANWGGGNTSTKTTIKSAHFTGLKIDDDLLIQEKEDMSDEDMVEYLGHCMIDASHPRFSIETLLHAFLPSTHVDHTHPDAIISIACADNGKEIAKE